MIDALCVGTHRFAPLWNAAAPQGSASVHSEKVLQARLTPAVGFNTEGVAYVV
jgi:hypothetical protein